MGIKSIIDYVHNSNARSIKTPAFKDKDMRRLVTLKSNTLKYHNVRI